MGTEDGGGIYNDSGSITLKGSTISGNVAEYFTGGGIANNSGVIAINGSIISENYAGAGGGIGNVNGTIEITNTTLSENRIGEDGPGAGISILRGQVTIDSSTISGHVAVLGAGGIDNQEGTVNLINTTVSNNSSEDDYSGGIINHSGTITLNNSTIMGNSAKLSGEGGGLKNIAGTVQWYRV